MTPGEKYALALLSGDSPVMTIAIDAVGPTEIPHCEAVRSSAFSASGRRVLMLLFKLAGAILVAGLVGFNAWWYWRESRPLEDLATISRWMTHDQSARAELALREHLRRSPHDGAVRVMLARALATRGDLLSCARQLQQVPYWHPQKPEALYREGQAFLQLDRVRDAERAWLELIKDDPLHPVSAGLLSDAYKGLLKIYAILDHWEDAYPIIWNAYDRSSGSEERLYWLTMRMRAELERVAPKESIVELRRYVAADPDDCESLHALARAEIALGERDLGERHFAECLKRRPDYVRAWRDGLTGLLEQGEFDRFLAMLRVPPPSADNDPETWFFRGVASEKAGDWRMAAAHFQKGIELNPFHNKCYYRLGMAQGRLGLSKEAAANRRKSTEINEARGQFPVAYAAFFDSYKSGATGASAPAASARRLAAFCDTLGWARAAQAWNRQADGL
jgi:tetratricopeptide (TPR) repeat protein